MNYQKSPTEQGKLCGFLGCSENINPYDEDDYRNSEWMFGWMDGQKIDGSISVIDWTKIKIESALKYLEKQRNPPAMKSYEK